MMMCRRSKDIDMSYVGQQIFTHGPLKYLVLKLDYESHFLINLSHFPHLSLNKKIKKIIHSVCATKSISIAITIKFSQKPLYYKILCHYEIIILRPQVAKSFQTIFFSAHIPSAYKFSQIKNRWVMKIRYLPELGSIALFMTFFYNK